ncbi:MAG TPA: type IV toxin-antitoxin system AbiEi family antitoxin domain-containing protein [Clostridiales bacterium]|nr:type IV toxin-antitoxin system AbiEi family antitoxin domain-containing protein [Clostridiales bacterium]HQP69137.1 type IV toxin-antitoxin system AbiEi family antitoxin domain-containing protein [Clostridiales bacterium]
MEQRSRISVKEKKIIDLIKKKGVVRAKEAEVAGTERIYLTRMVTKGLIVRVARGLYGLPGADFKGYDSYVEVAKKVPSGVICLISALSFHNVTTQISGKIHIAVQNNTWKPQIDSVDVKYYSFFGDSYSYGIEEHKIKNVVIKVYSPAKTVADCFKFRNKIGIDVAVEALKEIIRGKKASIAEIYEAAKVCSVNKVIQPYMESLN